jgi:UDP-N-acetylmuramyl tripeptide synthase
VIENREEAIKSAIKESKEESIILIAGKGHEDYQEIKGVQSHFSDKEVAENYLRF